MHVNIDKTVFTIGGYYFRFCINSNGKWHFWQSWKSEQIYLHFFVRHHSFGKNVDDY